ncbi:MAG TPA: hypothetical protein IGS31_10075 [Oscillatoriales cyanobacterium M4454_W2019_049]|nr:hypothetical protein [Oscillatoriales cyanobacterium M4454_W2019_049]
MQRLAEMTIEDLRALILQILQEQQQHYIWNRSIRSLDEILDSIDRSMWTPPPGAKSTLELLREDRDR